MPIDGDRRHLWETDTPRRTRGCRWRRCCVRIGGVNRLHRWARRLLYAEDLRRKQSVWRSEVARTRWCWQLWPGLDWSPKNGSITLREHLHYPYRPHVQQEAARLCPFQWSDRCSHGQRWTLFRVVFLLRGFWLDSTLAQKSKPSCCDGRGWRRKTGCRRC